MQNSHLRRLQAHIHSIRPAHMIFNLLPARARGPIYRHLAEIP